MSMRNQTDAIVLAGGAGTRLRARVSDRPKPMALVADRPFLEYILRQLEAAGIQRIVLSVGFMHEVITSHFGARWRSLEIVYDIESEPLGTGGAIRSCLAKTNSHQVFVLNGDSIVDVDLNAMAQFHFDQGADMTMALARVDANERYGRVKLEGDRVVGFEEKSKATSEKQFSINGGVYLLEKQKILPLIPEKRCSFEVDVMPEVLKTKLYGYLAKGFFIDIGVGEDFDRAQQETFLKGMNRDLSSV